MAAARRERLPRNWGWAGGKGRLRSPDLVDGQAQKLRQLDRLLVGVIVGGAVAHEHDGAGGVEEEGGGAGDALGAGPRRVMDGAGGHDVHVGDALEGVGGEADVDGPLRVGVGLVEGAADGTRHLAGVGELDGPLGGRPGELGKVGLGLVHLANVVIGGGDDHGGAGVEGVEHEGDAVGEAVIDVEADEGGAPGGAGVGLGHAYGDAFLKGQKVAHLRVVAEQVDEGGLAGAGVAEDVLDALCLEHLEERLFAGHRFRHGGLRWIPASAGCGDFRHTPREGAG